MGGAFSVASLAADEAKPTASQRNEAAVVKYLLPVLYASGTAIRLNYVSDCRRGEAVPFPHVAVQAPDGSKRALDAVRQIFEKDKSVSVIEDASGVITIQIGERPPDVLRTLLSRLALNPLQQYNPAEAFRALVGAQQMQATMHSRAFESVWDRGSTVVEPSEGFSHLPPNLDNVTAEQVLDRIARTWAGQIIVIYGVCAEPARSGEPTLFWLGWAGRVGKK